MQDTEDLYSTPSEYTNLNEEHVRIISDLGLFQAFDFYCDPTGDHLRLSRPTIPDDWRERDATVALNSSTVSMIDGEFRDSIANSILDVIDSNGDVQA